MQYENLPTTVEVQSEKLMDRNGQNALVQFIMVKYSCEIFIFPVL